ncbi:MAG: hypothetical protein ACK45B_04955 [Limisphaerales bacterium]
MNEDREQLRLLAIFHYVVGALLGLCSFLPVIHLVLGWLMVFRPHSLGPGEPPPAFMGWFFMGFAVVAILAGLTLTVLTIVAGRRLARFRSRTFCIVIAALLCLFMPIGTALGVFTIIVLMRPSVKQLFDAPPAV